MGNATGLSGLLYRTENDVRGRKVTNGPQKHKGTRVSRQNSVVDTPAVAGKVSRQNSESRLARTNSATASAEDTSIFVTGNLKKNLNQLKRAMQRLFEMEEEAFIATIKEYANEL